jgi:hypothetical protein
MGPSQNQLRLLSPQDRALYKQWLRRTLLFYTSLVALLALAAFADHLFTAPPDSAGDPVQTAAMSARK